MIDAHGELIYIGKAKNLRVRLLSYFRSRSRPAKAGRIMRHTVSLVWESWPSEFAALLRELELIRRWRPRCNVHGQPLRLQKAFVCLGREPAPYVFLTGRPPQSALATFGPVPSGRRAISAVCRINDLFQLRDCPQAQEMIFPDQGGLYPLERAAGCLRFDIGTCLGPCTGTCARSSYFAKVKAARRFLEGKEEVPLETLRIAMDQAARAEQFERAAALRDRLEAIAWLTARLGRLRQARARMTFVYPVAGAGGQILWYVVHGGRTVVCLTKPADEVTARAARQTFEAIESGQARGLLETHENVDGMMLVMSWFRKYPQELAKTLTFAQARASCDAYFLPRPS